MADFMYRIDLSKKLEKIWNKPKYSDTLFLVNNSKFHASSHLVSASSDVLDSLLDTHYQNCDDREITMGGIKNDESFLVILKCIYGMELNFTQMSKSVMCEVLRLCETYGLTDFSNAIKCFLSTLDCFQLDSVVSLLNTAKKFSLNKLYEKLSIFAYLNADQLIKHENFAELQFDVLQNLLKSNWFYASEVDILMGTLIWHSANMNPCPSNARDTLAMIESASVAEESDASSDGQSDVSGGETDVITTDSSHKNVSEKNKITFKSAGPSSTNFNKNNQDSETVFPDQTDSCAELVKTFSDNVLKSLLSHIRIKQISVFESLKAFETESLFTRYKVFHSRGTSFFSDINEPRTKYEQKAVLLNLCDITKKFTVRSISRGANIYESEEEYLIGDFKWKVCLKNSSYNIHMYLKCVSDKPWSWECTTECQFKILPCKPGYDSLVLPEDGSYKSVTLTSDNSCVEVCQYNYWNKFDSSSWFNVYPSCHRQDSTNVTVYTFEVHFKSIHHATTNEV